MLLQQATWQEVDGYLKDSTGIIVPIGSTEQHGPMGLIGTDALCPEVIAHRVSADAGILVGPTISVGMAQHHLGFSGSITLRPTTLIAVIKDYVLSLARNGFDRFYFLNGHGGNIHTIGAAFSEIYAERSLQAGSNAPGIRCHHQDWFALPAAKRISAECFGDREGSHATPSEISITQYAYPDAIKSMPADPAPAAPRWFTDADDYRALFPDGRIEADSFMASPEVGKRIVDECAAEVVESFNAFTAQA